MDGVDGSISPGTASPSPKTRSAGDALMSGLRVVRMANMTMGSLQYHSSGVSFPRAMRASFNLLWKRSTNPFASGW